MFNDEVDGARLRASGVALSRAKRVYMLATPSASRASLGNWTRMK